MLTKLIHADLNVLVDGRMESILLSVPEVLVMNSQLTGSICGLVMGKYTNYLPFIF